MGELPHQFRQVALASPPADRVRAELHQPPLRLPLAEPVRPRAQPLEELVERALGVDALQIPGHATAHRRRGSAAGSASAASVRQSGAYRRRSRDRNAAEVEPGETRSVRPASPSPPRSVRVATTPPAPSRASPGRLRGWPSTNAAAVVSSAATARQAELEGGAPEVLPATFSLSASRAGQRPGRAGRPDAVEPGDGAEADGGDAGCRFDGAHAFNPTPTPEMVPAREADVGRTGAIRIVPWTRCRHSRAIPG